MRVLQLSAVDLTLETAVFGTLAVVILGLGIAITYIAFRGYRRNQSRPMLFIALGFGLILLVQVALLPVDLLLDVDRFVLQTLTQLGQVVGMLAILHALTMDA